MSKNTEILTMKLKTMTLKRINYSTNAIFIAAICIGALMIITALIS